MPRKARAIPLTLDQRMPQTNTQTQGGGIIPGQPGLISLSTKEIAFKLGLPPTSYSLMEVASAMVILEGVGHAKASKATKTWWMDMYAFGDLSKYFKGY